jgi:hypothetical protein
MAFAITPRTSSEVSLVLHGDVPVPAEDEVIHDVNVEELCRRSETARVRDVFVRRLRITGRVIVKHDDMPRVEVERETHDIACAHRGGVQRADEHLPLGDDPAARVEEDDAEVLLDVQRVPRNEPRHVPIDAKQLSLSRCGPAARELDRSGEANGIPAAEARGADCGALQERCETIAEEQARRSEIRLRPNAAAGEDGHELRVTERSCTVAEESRRWMLIVPEWRFGVRWLRDRRCGKGDDGARGSRCGLHVRLR